MISVGKECVCAFYGDVPIWILGFALEWPQSRRKEIGKIMQETLQVVRCWLWGLICEVQFLRLPRGLVK